MKNIIIFCKSIKTLFYVFFLTSFIITENIYASEKHEVDLNNKVLICARIADCLKTVLTNIDEKKSTEDNESLKTQLKEIIKLAQKGKSQENNKQAFKKSSKKQRKTLEKTTKDLLKQYCEIRYEISTKFPNLKDKMPSLPVLATY